MNIEIKNIGLDKVVEVIECINSDLLSEGDTVVIHLPNGEIETYYYDMDWGLDPDYVLIAGG